jgi:hypothetical protein
MPHVRWLRRAPGAAARRAGTPLSSRPRPGSQRRSEPAAPPRPTAEYQVFLGLDTPPTSYGGYGGNAKEAPK